MPDDLLIRSLLLSEEVGICGRLRQAREQSQKRQADFARELGISRVRLASYEYAKAPLRYEIGKEICYRLNLNQRWFATGKLPMQPYFDISPNLEFKIKPKSLFGAAYRDILEVGIEERFKELEALLGKEVVREGDIIGAVLDNFHLVGESVSKAAAFYARRVVQLYLTWLPDEVAMDYINSLLNAHRKFQKQHSSAIAKLIAERQIKRSEKTTGDKSALDTNTEVRNSTSEMKLTLEALLSKVRHLTEPVGMKAKLAADLGVPATRVSEWLAGKHDPSGEVTLQLLNWVERQKRKK